MVLLNRPGSRVNVPRSCSEGKLTRTVHLAPQALHQPVSTAAWQRVRQCASVMSQAKGAAMRMWFAEVPVYPHRAADLASLAYGGAGVAIAAVVACLGQPGEGSHAQTWRFLVTFGTWLLLGLVLLLAGRGWARRRSLPFVPRQHGKALRLAWDGARPLPAFLLWHALPMGGLIGIVVAQLSSGHPFWQAGVVWWTTGVASGIGAVIGSLIRRARAPLLNMPQVGSAVP